MQQLGQKETKVSKIPFFKQKGFLLLLTAKSWRPNKKILIIHSDKAIYFPERDAVIYSGNRPKRIYTAHNSEKSWEWHSLTFSYSYPGGFSILLRSSNHHFTASQVWPADHPDLVSIWPSKYDHPDQLPRKPKKHFFRVRKRFPLIQNKPLLPPSCWFTLQIKLRKNDKQLFALL